MTPGELASASLAAGVTAASPLIGALDADSGMVAFVGGVGMWCGTMFKNWLDHRERMAKFEADVTDARAKLEADVTDVRAEIKRISALGKQLAAALKVDREWMLRVAAKTGEALPVDFGNRPFDQPSTDVNPIINLGSDDDLTPPRSQDAQSPGK